MSVEREAEQARVKMAETAQAMLNGTLSFIEGARQIASLREQAKLNRFDPDIIPFVAIDSETDALPFGPIRRLWAPDALAKLQPEIDAAETWAKDNGAEHCQTLIGRFKPAT